MPEPTLNSAHKLNFTEAELPKLHDKTVTKKSAQSHRCKIPGVENRYSS